MNKYLNCLLALVFMTSCSLVPGTPNPEEKQAKIDEYGGETAEAIFAGGCFWCIEAVFEKDFPDAVIAAISGFAGGEEKNPAYKEVASGRTGHREAVRVVYDPEKVSYRELVDFFWRQFDPTDAGGSFYDRGFQYSSAVYYIDEEQKKEAEASKKELEESGVFDDPIVTEIIPATNFYPAEDYHQDYYLKNPIRYKYYREGSGRDKFFKETWNK